MHDQPTRIEAFKAEIAEMHIADPSTGRDRLATRGGLVAMAVGVALPIVAYFISHGTENPLQQRDAIVVALLGVSLAVAGGALVPEGSIGRLPALLAHPRHPRAPCADRSHSRRPRRQPGRAQ